MSATDSQNTNRPERKPLKMGIYYDIIAGMLYIVLAFVLNKRPPEAVSADIIQIVMIVFALYGVFRIGRGVYRLRAK
jgi:hypothetical membrane protein